MNKVVDVNAKLDELRRHRKAREAKPESSESDSEPGVVARRASDVDPKPIDWIWTGRIARGKHTAIAGEPGTGKSTLICEIIAAVTTGGQWPCDEGRACKGSVLILSAEDDAEHTIVPRLMAAGADLTRIRIIEAVRSDDGRGTRSFNLQVDIARLEKLIAEIGDVALIIIDPISSYMGKADSHKNAEVRGVLEPLSKTAERTGAAVISITHFSKAGASNGAKALHRFIGSIAFIAAARMAFAVMADPEDEQRRLFLHVKNNLSAPPKGLAFRLWQRIVGDPGKAIIGSHVMWDPDPVSITANQALAAEASQGDQSALAEAEEFLRDLLAAGPTPQKDIRAAADGSGIAWATVRRAKQRLGVVTVRETEGFGKGAGRWVWSIRCSPPPQGAHENNVSTLCKDEHLMGGAPAPTPNGHIRAPFEIPPHHDRPSKLGPPVLGPDGDDLGDLR